MFDFILLLSTIILIIIDFMYLRVIRSHFSKQIQKVQGSAMKVNYLGAAISYVFLVIALNYFIIKPRKSVSDAFLLGLIIYGVFESTNYALLSNWSLITVFIDTIWGGVLFATTTYLVRFIQ